MQLFKRIGAGVVGLLMLGGSIALATPAQATELPRPTRSASDHLLTTGGLYQPKGNPAVRAPKTSDSRVASATAATTTVYRTYAGARRILSTPAADNGCSVYSTVHNQWVSSADEHALFECSVHIGKNIVEIGWRKYKTDTGPKLFSYLWKDVNGVSTPQCYNTCGFVSSSGTPGVPASCTPGQDLTGVVGQSKMFYIQHFDSVWWLAYDGQWCGYYPDTALGGTVKDRADMVQIFDEICGRQYIGTGASPDISTDMGAAKLPAVAGAQEITKMHVVGTAASTDVWSNILQADGGVTVNTAHYNLAQFTNTADSSLPRNYRWGGAGSY